MQQSLNHVINLDKPPDISSAGAVGRVKRLLPRGTKIGHAGTLDPFATGVLLLLVGRATRLCETFMDLAKQYEATIKLGATTVTDDCASDEQPFIASYETTDLDGSGLIRSTEESAPHAGPLNVARQNQFDPALVSRQQLEQVLPSLVGAIQQRPPAFSALKVGGRRAYDLARQGNDVRLEARTVHVYGIDLLDFAWPLARIRVDCGRGTYIRALARDIGAALNVGGYLTQLRRTRIGSFTAAGSVSLERLMSDGVEPHLIAQ